MLIDRIARLQQPGVLHDFKWPAELPTFGRYNLIYGWNGSGKTTISKVLRSLEQKTTPDEGKCTLTLNGVEVSSTSFGAATVPVRVFNRDFIAESVFPAVGSDLPPILVLGKENVEAQKRVEQLKNNIKSIQATIESKKRDLTQAETNLDKLCIDRAAEIKKTLRSSGDNFYNNYDKAKFRDRATKILTDTEGPPNSLTESERDSLLAQHHSNPKPTLQPLSFQLPALDVFYKAASDFLSTSVVSEAIQSLKENPALVEWVREGINLHRERQAEACLFCDLPLPTNRLQKLEAHFNAEYEGFLDRLNSEIERINIAAEIPKKVTLPNKAELYEDLAAEYVEAAAAFNREGESATRFLKSLAQELAEKKDRPFQKLTLRVSPPVEDNVAVPRLNDVIRKHNQATNEFQTRVSAARKRLEADFIASTLADFQALRNAMKEADRSIQNAQPELINHNNEVNRLESEIVEHRQPAEELNNDLRNYLGHSDLFFEIKDTGYIVSRSGVPAIALSEGETTAIALLYYLKTLKDKRFDLSKGVVVLDDPISSLDSNALFLAFGFIRERTKDAAQLIILTHNFIFFRQVRNWFHNISGQRKKVPNRRPARFYMLDCLNDRKPRCSVIRLLDPLLERFESEYHYLFHCIYRRAKAVEPVGLEDNYGIPNIARRVLEAFLAFRQPSKSDSLSKQMEDSPFDEAKKVRILRLLHTYSHGDAIREPAHDLSVLAEAGSVLKDLLEFIEEQDPGHYAAMVNLVQPSA